MNPPRPLTGRQLSFSEDEIIVSKTDLRGIMTYVNDVFIRVSGYEERELLGAPHNLIRHPKMPRAVFKLLWDTIKRKEEIFAYVLNRARSGDEYWVFAHVTPSFDSSGKHVGYHSNRRSPYLDALPAVKQLYAAVLAEEEKHRVAADAAAAGTEVLLRAVEKRGVSYPEFVFSLSKQTTLTGASR